MSEFKAIPAGTYNARCCGVVDIGTHEEEWDGKKSMKHKMIWMFSIPELMVEFERDGEKITRPMTTSVWLNKSNTFHEKSKMLKFLNGWRGKPMNDADKRFFRFNKLIGASAVIEVVNYTGKNGNMKDKIVSISHCKDEVPALEDEGVYLDMDETTPEDWNEGLIKDFSPKIQDWIRRSVEWQERVGRDKEKHPTAEEFASSFAPDVKMGHYQEMDAFENDEIPF